MTIRRRLGRLELSRNQRQGAHKARHDRDEEELYPDCDNPEIFIRYDRAVEMMRLAMEEEARLGVETAEGGAATDEYLDALEELRKFSREVRPTGNEREER